MVLRYARKLAALFRLVVTAVIKSFIPFPGYTTEFYIAQSIPYLYFIIGFNNDHFTPVGSAL